jgi:hypothetical protein
VPATNVFDEHLLISKRPVQWLKVAVLSRCQVDDLCDVVLLGSKLQNDVDEAPATLQMIVTIVREPHNLTRTTSCFVFKAYSSRTTTSRPNEHELACDCKTSHEYQTSKELLSYTMNVGTYGVALEMRQHYLFRARDGWK